MLYSPDQIQNNPLYAELMQQLNQLYEQYGCPPMQAPHMSKKLKGEHACPLWHDEPRQAQLNQVYKALGIIGNGGLQYAETTPEWQAFFQAALQQIAAYHLKKKAFPPYWRIKKFIEEKK